MALGWRTCLRRAADDTYARCCWLLYPGDSAHHHCAVLGIDYKELNITTQSPSGFSAVDVQLEQSGQSTVSHRSLKYRDNSHVPVLRLNRF